jgi:hypothetical protein
MSEFRLARPSVIIAFAALPSLPTLPTFVGFAVGASVTRYAVVYVSDALFLVFCTNVCRGVFVAAETGVAFEIVTFVASRAGCVVVAIEQEESVVIKGRRRPTLRVVALRAGRWSLPVESVLRGCMTTLASRQLRTRECGVVEGGGRPVLCGVYIIPPMPPILAGGRKV